MGEWGRTSYMLGGTGSLPISSDSGRLAPLRRARFSKWSALHPRSSNCWETDRVSTRSVPIASRLVALAVVLMLVAAACSSGDDESEPEEATADSAAADSDEQDPSDATTTDAAAPVEGFVCGPLADLDAALAGARPASEAELADTGWILTPVDRWVAIQGSSGLHLVDSLPLMESPRAYVIVPAGGQPQPCVDLETPVGGEALAAISCAVRAEDDIVTVEWSPLAPGVNIDVARDGELLYSATSADNPTAIADAPFVQRMLDYGENPVDGASLSSGVIGGSYLDLSDGASPDAEYTLDTSAADGTTLSVLCGDALSAGTETASGDLTGDLADLNEQFQTSFIGPYGYATITPICADCDGTYEVVFGAGPDNRLTELLTPTNSRVDEFLVAPAVLYQLIEQAEQAGGEVDFAANPDTGLIAEWTIAGSGAAIECYDSDTAPPEARTGCSGGEIVGS